MANTYELIQAQTLGSASSSVSFTSIPSTYTDLKLVMSVRSSFSAVVEGMFIRFNNDTTSGNYSYKRLFGSGSGSSSDSSTAPVFMNGATSTASTFTNNELYMPNYTSSSAKSMSADLALENNATTAYVGLVAALWTGTAAINSIQFTSENGANFVQYSSFYLYGIKNS